MNATKQFLLASVAALGTYTFAAPIAYAQSKPEAKQDGEIIVTARRREEALQDTPIAVTAFTGAALQERGISDLRELANVTPGYSFGYGFGSSLGGVATIRAQAQAEPEMALDPSVGFYFDDVYIARQSGTLATMFDVSSVQVLKGPQGTLFGRNTPGGAIVVTTNQPELGVFGGNVSATAGNYSARKLNGALNIPVGEKIALRIGGSHSEHDGYSRSSFLNEELEDEDVDAWRAQALVELSDNARLTLAYNGSHADQAGVNYFLTEVDPNGLANFLTGGLFVNTLNGLTNPRNNPVDAPHFETLDTDSYAGTFDWDVDGINVKLIAARRELYSNVGYDNDGTPATILHLSENSVDQSQNSLELRVSGKALNDKLDWITGAYFLDEKGTDVVTFNQFGAALGTFDSDIKNRAYSVFAQGDYSFTDKLSATLGVRVGRDERGVVMRPVTTVLAGPGAGLTFCQLEAGVGMNLDEATGGCRTKVQKDFDNYAYQTGLNYKASDDLLLYVTHRRGYRSGVFNERATQLSELQPFKPEVILDFEGGAKQSWRYGDWRGTANLAVWYSKFKNRQLTFNDFTAAGGATTVLDAAAKAHAYGAELELSARYSNWLNLWASTARTEAKYDRFVRRPTLAFPGGLDVSSLPVANVPNIQYNVGGRVNFPINEQLGAVFVQADYQYTGSQFFGFNPRASAADNGHGLLDLSAGLQDINSGAGTLSFFVHNATKENYRAGALNLGFNGGPATANFGYSTALLGAPRTWGVELQYAF